MSSIFRRPGEALNLNLQLHDGLDTFPRRVFVELCNSSGTQVEAPFEIPHKGGGLFLEDQQLMPTSAADFLRIARFMVRDADGTTPSTIHSDETDVYQLDLAGERVLNNLDIPISSVENNPQGLIGIVEGTQELIGVLDGE